MISTINNIVRNHRRRLFDRLVSKRLIYNACWEDPRIDRELLQIDDDSEVVMLSSAGCNALSYLLDNPQSVHCVDANPAQNALLNLKLALFEHGDYELLWEFFGKGHLKQAAVPYRQILADRLPEESRRYWNTHIHYFSQTSGEPSFYYRGTSGKIALVLYKMIRHKGLYSSILNLLDAKSIEEQKYYFREIAPRLLDNFYSWFLQRDTTLALLGVPKAQRRMIERDYEDGLLSFVRSSLQHVFTEVPIRDNYFWRVYLRGSYTQDCCPAYLKSDHFNTLRTRVSTVGTHTQELSRFLEQHPGSYSHFVLLDHMDWMAHTNPAKLEQEWKLILDNARSGSRILFRSAGRSHDFLPDFVFDYVGFPHSKLTQELHQKDRVGTYGSTHLGVVA